MTPPAVVELDGVQMTYGGATMLDVPALGLHEGEILTVIGPNGSGKSTLLRIAGLLERPTRGVVRFRGRPVDAPSSLAERRRMATVFQHPLLADMTVAQNVALGLKFRGVGDANGERVRRWLERLGIAPLRDQRARTLSGGQAQRVALARALVLEPEVLLLDEPFAGLDAPTRAELLPDLGAILRQDRVTTMLVAAPANVGADVRVGLRPEDVTLLLPTEVAPLSSARNYLTGTIVQVTPSTPAVRVVVNVGFPLVATVTARSVADLGLAEGVPIIAAFKASAAHLIGPR